MNLGNGHKPKTRAEINRFDAKAYFSWRFDADEKGRYFILWGGDVRTKLIAVGTSDLHTGRDSLDMVDVDGIPTTVMRCTERYENAVVGCTNVNEAYSLIANRFAECDIRWLFPELWIAWKNAKAKKEQRRVEHDYLEARKQCKLCRRTQDEMTIRVITQFCDLKAAARHYGVL